jgi:hypothetical protein
MPVLTTILLATILPWQLFGLFAASRNISVEVCSPHDNVTIISPEDGTTKGKKSIMVGGYATADAVVSAYRNNSAAGTVTSSSDGSYSLSVPLEFGDNFIYTRTTNPCGQNTDSAPVTVHRPAPPKEKARNKPLRTTEHTQDSTADPEASPAQSDIPPDDTEPLDQQSLQPVITKPADGLVTASPIVLLKGLAALDVLVTITRNNEQVAEVLTDEKGEFAVSVPLVAGKNVITVAYSQPKDNAQSASIEVTYRPGATATSTVTPDILTPVLIASTSIFSVTSGLLLWHHFRRPHIKLPPTKWHVHGQ